MIGACKEKTLSFSNSTDHMSENTGAKKTVYLCKEFNEEGKLLARNNKIPLLKRKCSLVKKIAGNCISIFDRSVSRVCGSIELAFSECKDMIHFKYIIRPVYKCLSSRVGRPIATIATFFLADCLFHKPPAYLMQYMNKGQIKPDYTDLYSNMCWTALGCMVAYSKYKNHRPNSDTN
ncbi:hypothetical protein [Endozoicomonas sp. 2B-B]